MAEIKKVSFFDPALNVFREISVERAIKLIENAKKLEAQLKAKGLLK